MIYPQESRSSTFSQLMFFAFYTCQLQYNMKIRMQVTTISFQLKNGSTGKCGIEFIKIFGNDK